MFFVHISIRLYDWSDSQSLKITGKAILLEIFWSGNETSGLLTKPVNMLLEWTVYSHREKCKSDDVSRINLQMNNNCLWKKYIFELCIFFLYSLNTWEKFKWTQIYHCFLFSLSDFKVFFTISHLDVVAGDSYLIFTGRKFIVAYSRFSTFVHFYS